MEEPVWDPRTCSIYCLRFFQHLDLLLAHKKHPLMIGCHICFLHCHQFLHCSLEVCPLSVSYYVGTLGTHTEIKKVAEEKVTLPCHHQLGLPEKDTLDIEWLLTDNEGNQKVVSIPRPEPSPSPPRRLPLPFLHPPAFFVGLERATIILSSGLELKNSRYKT